jgi:hypothetical protein
VDASTIVNAIAAGRVAIGTAAVVAPRFAGGTWIGAPADDPAVAVFARAMGARDVAVGIATMRAVRYRQGARTMALLGAACDAMDFAATVVAFRRIGRRRAVPVLVMAGGAAVATALAVRAQS